jgi:hypothetical protein
MRPLKDDDGRPEMEIGNQKNPALFSGTGEPRSGDVAITVLTALILLAVLVVVALF